MDLKDYKQVGIILISVEDPITQLLRNINKQYYSIVGFYFKNPDLNFILGDMFGVHMSRHMDTKWSWENLTSSNIYKLASNIVLFDYIKTDTNIFVNKIKNNIITPTSTDRLDDYHWMTSIFGYQLPKRRHMTCYEVINNILSGESSEDIRFRFNLIKSKSLSEPNYITLKPPKDLFKLQQQLISSRKEYIYELVNIFSEIMIKSPPFYQIIYNYKNNSSENINNLISKIIDIQEDIDNDKIPIINLNEIITTINNISKNEGIYKRLELIQGKSIGAVIIGSDEKENIQIKLKSGKKILIPTIGYDLSEFTKDECLEILSVVDIKSNKTITYETLKTDLTKLIANKK